MTGSRRRFIALSRDGFVHNTVRIQTDRLSRLPEAVAATARFLAPADSSFVTGAQMCVDGGMTA
ncbi:SDR family oxidoreductase [Paraburkholderia sp. SG-MS1]|uniref:SDR family oxidoreductase n=1 Tax=Paraburkholderia sp. SG-MS1 TaxID=2023741 RepID=UPI0031398725